MSQSLSSKITTYAPAKINLFLHIIGKTKNNYHSVQSLIAFTDLVDTIEINQANTFAFTTDHEALTENNLVVQAAEKLARLLKRPLDLSIHLTKKIPVGAGLGGGSADAAATIKGLLHYWNKKIPADQLNTLLSSLGADVPACYQKHACYAQGFGEVITPLDLMPPCPAVLIYPNIFCSTAEIFKNYSADYSQKIDLPSGFATQKDLYTFLKTQQNDLTESACSLHPEISDALKIMSKQEGCDIARMSGSGSSCFGLFNTAEQSQKAAEKIQKEKPDWFIRPVTLR